MKKNVFCKPALGCFERTPDISSWLFHNFFLRLGFHYCRDSWNGESISGLPTPPHSVVVDASTPETIQLTWTTPVISHPEDSLKYR